MHSLLARRFAHASSLLHGKLEAKIPAVRERVKNLQKNHGDKIVDDINIGSVIGGMRDLPVMFYVGSALDPIEGIRFRGHTIPEMAKILPKAETEMLPEAVLWLLLTGDAPTAEELKEIQSHIITDKPLPKSTHDLILHSCKHHHAMTVLSMAILDLQRFSKFATGYAQGSIKKTEYWKPTLEDGLFILSYLPQIAALIYTTKFGKTPLRPGNHDWAGRYSELMGFKSNTMAEVIRGYLSIHTDHEGGNVSAHTAWLVNSALSDPFLALSSAINGLAGPLHGLANQEVLKFVMPLRDALHKNKIPITSSDDPKVREFVRQFTEDWLKSAVVPGYGHAKLRNTDPRFTFLKEQALRYMPEKDLVKVVHACEAVIPEVLKKLGKVKNPFPNVDAHSGVLLYELGLTEFDYYTVIFGVSRAIGCISNMVWARALGLPIERPGSLTLEQLEDIANGNKPRAG